MPSQAPRRLHHSRAPSEDWRPIMPISMMIVIEKAYSTKGGPQTNARHNPVAGLRAQTCSTIMITQRSACRTGTATNGAPNAAATPFQSRRLVTEQNERSQSETKTTDSGNGQYDHAVVNSWPKPSKVASPTSLETVWVSPHRMAATKYPVAIMGRTTTACAHPCV